MRYDLDSVCSGQDLALCQSSEREERTERERNDGGAVDVRLASRVESRLSPGRVRETRDHDRTDVESDERRRESARTLHRYVFDRTYIYIYNRPYIYRNRRAPGLYVAAASRGRVARDR